MRHRDPNNRRRGLAGALAVLALVAVAGCGGDDNAGSDPADAEASDSDAGTGGDGGDDSADTDTDTDSGGDAGDSSGASDGDGSVDAGGGDFPIPAPDGLILDALVDAGLNMDGQRQLYYPNDDFDRLVAFYDDWTSQNGEWSRSEAEGTVVFLSLDGSLRQISITPDQDPGAQADGPAAFVLLVAG